MVQVESGEGKGPDVGPRFAPWKVIVGVIALCGLTFGGIFYVIFLTFEAMANGGR